MVLFAFILITVMAGIWFGLKTEPFDIVKAIGAWGVGALLSVMILGMMAWHSVPHESTTNVSNVINLEVGRAVATDNGGKYIRSSVTDLTHDCETPTLTQIKYKTHPYLLGFTVTTSTYYKLCIPPDPLAQ